MPAATDAFSDSAPEIGIFTTTSQCWLTSRDRPLPSDPMTSASGLVAGGREPISVSASPSRPTTNRPAFAYEASAEARFEAWATGNLASAPADAFQAPAVTPAVRRPGISTPAPPNAATDLATAPRLRGSVTPSSATISGGWPAGPDRGSSTPTGGA